MNFDPLTANTMFQLAQTKASAAKLAGDVSQASFNNHSAREAAEEFEAVFVTTIVENMFSSVSTDGPFGGGHSEQVYRSMMNEEYANAIVKAGGIGLADNIYREILKLQEQSA